jgi:Fungal trichothecene efflux pump (TRI12)
MLFLHISHIHDSVPIRRQIIRLDPLGTTLFLPGVTCFLLALQWGGTTYPWNNARIIALLVLAGVLVTAFIAVQISRQEDATIPPRIIKQRSIAFGTVYSLCIGGGLISMLYTLPPWFQAVKGTSAVQSGVNTVPMVLALVIGAMLAGGMVTRTGYYVPWMFVATIFMSAGSGLMTTFDVHTGHAKWIGYQVLFGIGIGTGMQQPNLAAQTVLERKDVSIGISLMFFSQSLGGAVFVCIGQSLFTNHLASTLPSISNIDPGELLAAGATELVNVVPADKLSEILNVYNGALVRAFTVAVAVSSSMVLPALGMDWRSVKKSPPSKPAT